LNINADLPLSQIKIVRKFTRFLPINFLPCPLFEWAEKSNFDFQLDLFPLSWSHPYQEDITLEKQSLDCFNILMLVGLVVSAY